MRLHGCYNPCVVTTSRILSAVPWGKMGRRPFLNVKSAEASRNKITYCRGSPSHDARQSFYRDKGSLLVQLVCCTARQCAFVWSSACKSSMGHNHVFRTFVNKNCGLSKKAGGWGWISNKLSHRPVARGDRSAEEAKPFKRSVKIKRELWVKVKCRELDFCEDTCKSRKSRGLF